MTDEERAAEIERLEAKRDASRARGDGYGARIKAIETRLEDLRNGK